MLRKITKDKFFPIDEVRKKYENVCKNNNFFSANLSRVINGKRKGKRREEKKQKGKKRKEKRRE